MNNWIWLPDATDVWLPVKLDARPALTAAPDDTVSATSNTLDASGAARAFKVKVSEANKLLTAAPVASSSLAMLPDMIHLEELTEAAILHTLRARFQKDQIYTYISSILVSVNPYRQLPLYTPELMRLHHARAESILQSPHPYALAENAYRGLGEHKENQSVIISGESGAGKTEATKIILQYLSYLSGQGNAIEKQILDANPIMESFGNAKTVRNNNSSRFGKFIEVYFDRELHIVGASITSYLLEKIRVVRQSPGERNYHIFYQVLAGLSDADKEKYHIATDVKENDVNEFSYLKGGRMNIDGQDEKKEYAITMDALRCLKFGEPEIAQLCSVVCAILHTGNIRFAAPASGTPLPGGAAGSGQQGAQQQAVIVNDTEVVHAAQLLSVPKASLVHALMNQSMRTVGEVLFVPQPPEKCEASRDALAKHVYGRMFGWLIDRINASLKTAQVIPAQTIIGVLDIFGFERFEVNRFEQLCINYTNEKLQQHFNQHVFILELNLYKAEDIKVDDVKFTDNQLCLDLIERPVHGILAVLDEELRLPKGSDDNFLTRLMKANEPKSGMKHFIPTKKRAPIFTIAHYAGEVTYDVTGFCENNKDTLHADLIALMATSENPFLASLFGGGNGMWMPAGAPALASAVSSTPGSPSPIDTKSNGAARTNGNGAPSSPNPLTLGRASSGSISSSTPQRLSISMPSTPGGNASSSKQSLATQFKTQLGLLMGNLNRTQPHFVRCLKPNSTKSASSFDSKLVLEQLRYSGIEAVISVRKQGFPVRHNHKYFYDRYSFLMGKKPRSSTITDLRKACSELVPALLPSEFGVNIHVGLTKVFMRSGPKSSLEAKREAKLGVRGFLARKRYKKLLAARAAIKAAIAIPPRSLTALRTAIASATAVKLRALEVKAARAILDRWTLEDEVKAELDGAWEVHRLTPLTAALARADTIKLDESEPALIRCRKWKIECDDTLSGLKAAIDKRDLDALNSGLKRAEPLGVAVEPTAVDAQQWATRLAGILSGLESAVAARDLMRLTLALGQADDAQFLPSPLYATAKALHAKLNAERAAREALTRAISSRSIDKLSDAIDGAAAIGVTADSDSTTGGALVKEAIDLRARLLLEQKLSSDLAAAIKADTVPALESAIGECRRAHFDCSELHTAQHRLTALVGEAVRAQLRAAINTRTIAALVPALERASQIALPASEPVLAEATTLHTQLAAELKALNDLSEAVSSSTAADCTPLERALATAEHVLSDNKSHSALASARAVLARLQLKHALIQAMSAHDLPQLDAVIGRAVDGSPALLDSNDADLLAATKWQRKLRALEERLNEATKERNLSALTSALATVEEYKFNTSVREAAERVAGQLTRQRDVVVLLEAATAAGDVTKLDSALVKAKECATECASVGGLAAETERAVQTATAARQLVLDQTKWRTELMRAYESKDSSACDQLLTRSGALRMDDSADAKTVRVWLGELSVFRKRFADATERRDVAALDEVIGAVSATESGVGTALDTELNAARQLSSQLKAAKAELAHGIDTRSIATLSAAIEVATKIGFGPSDTTLNDARRTLARWRELESGFEKAIEAGDLPLLVEAIAAAEEHKYTSERGATARALRNKLGGERDARAALAAAMTSTEPDVLRAALARATELGLPASDPAMQSCEKRLTKLLDDEKLRVALTQAVATRNLPRLDSLLSGKPSLDATDAALVAAIECQTKLQSAERELESATAARDLTALTAAIAAADELKFESSTKREAASRVAGQLTRQRELVAALEAAIAAADVSKLDAALTKARELATADGVAFAAETDRAVTAATNARQLLNDQSKLRTELTRALEARDVIACERLLTRVGGVQMEDASETNAVRAWLNDLNALRKRLANATEHRDVTVIDEVLALSTANGGSGWQFGAALDNELNAARQLSAQLKAAKAELAHAIESRSISTLSTAIEAATKVGFSSADSSISDARRLLLRWRELEASIDAAIDARDVAMLNASLAAADEQKYGSERISTARALRNKLGGERDARAALTAAMSSTDPDVLRAALARAHELGLAATDSAMAACEKRLAKLLEDEKLRTALTAAVAARNLPRLDNLLASKSSAGLDPNDAALLAATECRTKLQAIEHALAAATAARDHTKLTAAVASADEYKFESSQNRDAAARVLAQLTRQREVVSAIDAAIDAADFQRIDAALAKAKECAIECSTAGVNLAPETERAVQRAAATRQAMGEQNKLRDELTRRYDAKDVAGCEQLLTKLPASVSGGDAAESPASASAAALLQVVSTVRGWLREVSAFRRRLDTATEQRDVVTLDETVAAVVAASLSSSFETELAAAKQLSAKLKAVRAELSRVLSDSTRSSISALHAAIEAAAKLGFGGANTTSSGDQQTVLADARRVLIRWREIDSQLEKAIDSTDLIQLAAAVTAADEQKYASDRVLTARSLRSKLGGERDARAALAAAVSATEPEVVRQALTRARELQLSAADPAVAACDKRLAQLIEHERLRAAMTKAVADRDTAIVCQSLLDRAASVELSDTEPCVLATRQWMKTINDTVKRLAGLIGSSQKEKEIDVIAAAVTACSAIGLELDSTVVEAQSVLKRLRDVANKLRTAIDQHSLNGLSAGIDAGAKLGWSTAEPVLAEARTALTQWRALEAALEKSIEARDTALLASAVSAADDAKYNSERVTAARALRQKLGGERDAQAALAAVLTSTDPDAIRSAMQRARDGGLSSADPALLACDRRLAKLIEFEKWRAALNKAVSEHDVSTASVLVERAGVLFDANAPAAGDNESALVAARAWLKQVADTRKRVVNALSSPAGRDVDSIAAAVAACSAVGLDADPTVLEAQAALKSCRDAQTKCRLALAPSDRPSLSALAAAVDAATKCGLSPADTVVSDARRTLAAWRELESSLERSIESGDATQLSSALAAAEEQKYSSDRVTAARALRLKLGGEREARAALAAAVKSTEPDTIRAAIARAREMGFSGTDPSLVACEKRLVRLNEHDRVRAALTKAVSDRDNAQCTTLLDRATALELSESSEPAMQAARAWLGQSTDARKRLAALVSANSKEPDAIAAAVTALTTVGGSGAEYERAISDAQSIVKALKDVKSKLVSSVEQRSLSAIESSVDRASKLGLAESDADLAEARVWRTNLRSVDAALARALSTRNADDIAAALKEADGLKYSGDSVTAVQSLATAVGGESRVRRLLTEALTPRTAAATSGGSEPDTEWIAALKSAIDAAQSCGGSMLADPLLARAQSALGECVERQKMRSKLAAAYTARDEKRCTELLAQCNANETKWKRVTDSDDTQRVRNWLQAVSDARRRLAAATGADSKSERKIDLSAITSALNAFIELFASSGSGDSDSVVLSARQVLATGAGVERDVAQQLAVATAANEQSNSDVASLDSVLKRYTDFGFESESKDAVRARSILQKWKDAEVALSTALRSRQTDELSRALTAADAIPYRSASVQSVRRLIDELSGDEKVVTALTTALASNDRATIQSAVDRIPRSRTAVTSQPVYADCQKWLVASAEQTRLCEALARGIERGDETALETCVKRARELADGDSKAAVVPVSSDLRAALASAQRWLTGCTEYRSQLTAAVEGKRWDAVRQSLAAPVSGTPNYRDVPSNRAAVAAARQALAGAQSARSRVADAFDNRDFNALHDALQDAANSGAESDDDKQMAAARGALKRYREFEAAADAAIASPATTTAEQIRQLLLDASALKLSASHPKVAALRARDTEWTAQAEARALLAAAVAASNPQQLNAAIERARAVGLAAADVAKAQSLASSLAADTKLKQSLTRAIAARDATLCASILASQQATTSGDEKSAVGGISDLLAAAQAIVTESTAIRTAIRTAVSSKDVDAISAAIAKANAAAQPVSSDVESDIANAQSELRALVTEEVDAAIESRTVDALTAALALAKSHNLLRSKSATKATAILRALTREDAARRNLQAAIDAGVLSPAFERAWTEAADAKLTAADPVFAEAKELRTRLRTAAANEAAATRAAAIAAQQRAVAPPPPAPVAAVAVVATPAPAPSPSPPPNGDSKSDDGATGADGGATEALAPQKSSGQSTVAPSAEAPLVLPANSVGDTKSAPASNVAVVEPSSPAVGTSAAEQRRAERRARADAEKARKASEIAARQLRRQSSLQSPSAASASSVLAAPAPIDSGKLDRVFGAGARNGRSTAPPASAAGPRLTLPASTPAAPAPVVPIFPAGTTIAIRVFGVLVLEDLVATAVKPAVVDAAESRRSSVDSVRAATDIKSVSVPEPAFDAKSWTDPALLRSKDLPVPVKSLIESCPLRAFKIGGIAQSAAAGDDEQSFDSDAIVWANPLPLTGASAPLPPSRGFVLLSSGASSSLEVTGVSPAFATIEYVIRWTTNPADDANPSSAVGWRTLDPIQLQACVARVLYELYPRAEQKLVSTAPADSPLRAAAAAGKRGSVWSAPLISITLPSDAALEANRLHLEPNRLQSVLVQCMTGGGAATPVGATLSASRPFVVAASSMLSPGCTAVVRFAPVSNMSLTASADHKSADGGDDAASAAIAAAASRASSASAEDTTLIAVYRSLCVSHVFHSQFARSIVSHLRGSSTSLARRAATIRALERVSADFVTRFESPLTPLTSTASDEANFISVLADSLQTTRFRAAVQQTLQFGESAALAPIPQASLSPQSSFGVGGDKRLRIVSSASNTALAATPSSGAASASGALDMSASGLLYSVVEPLVDSGNPRRAKRVFWSMFALFVLIKWLFRR